ncbi:hypothetical protein [Petrachloros mirabilis]|jgi:tetratricopeptide (TPR) repeat protein
MMSFRIGLWGTVGLLLGTIFLTDCAHDSYQERAHLIKDHTETFYTHLKANRVEAAIRENERIEAMASEMAQTVRRRATQQGTTQVQGEFALMKTANEAAAMNWLALGQYFAVKKQYARSRATYQRILDTYPNPTDRNYREQASRAMEDLNILNPPNENVTQP